MNYQPTRIINQSLCIGLVALATFVSNCNRSSDDVAPSDTPKNWDGVQHAELKKQFKAFIGGWEGMTDEQFLAKVAQAVTKQAAVKSSKNKSKVVYYIPTKYIPSREEEITEEKRKGSFYQVVFQQEYSKISGKLKKIYDNLLVLPPDQLVRSKDANLFVVAHFFKFTEHVDQALKANNIENGKLIEQLKRLLQDFQGEIAKVYSQSDLYKGKNRANVAMGIMIKPNGERKIEFVKNTEANFAMNARCMLTKKLAQFAYEQCKEIKTEIDKLDKALKEAAKKATQTEHPHAS